MTRLARTGAAGAVALALLATTLPPTAATAAGCTDQTVKAGIVTATGCFTPVGGAFTTIQPFRMNGFDVKPHAGVTVTLTPGSARTAQVSTGGGQVDLTATSTKWGTILFRNLMFDVSLPASGDVTLVESALAQPAPVFTGLTPVAVKQPIKLTEEGESEFDLTFNAGGLFFNLVKGTEKQMGASVGFTVKDGTYALTSGEFSLEDFEIAELITINEAELKIGTDSFDVTADARLNKVMGPFGLRFGTTIEKNLMKRAELGVSGINEPLGATGIFLQKLGVGIFPNPPYGGKGVVGLSAGPSFNFLGRKVNAVEADGTIELRGADEANKKAGYFAVNGDFTLMSLPVANASFGYWFGQGTKFSTTVGIGFPSGKNDPAQPTYVGGGMSGWTSAKHFDLEGNVKLKLLGLDLLGANTVLSDLGMAGCVKAALWYVGGGVTWSPFQGYVLGGDTCDVGRFRPQAGMARDLRDGNASLRLRNGYRFVRVEAARGAAAPQVTLSAPGGPRLKSPTPADSDQIAKSPAGQSMAAQNGTTLFVLKGDPAGPWSLSTLPGSPPIGRVSVAKPLPDANVRAWVTGSGPKRRLHWSARDIRHQELQFSERLPNGVEVPILRTAEPSGVTRFRPADGAARAVRKLAVDVRQRWDSPRTSLVADRFRVGVAPKPEAVEGLRVQRQVGDVVARWNDVAGAVRYRVDARPKGAGVFYRTVVTKPKARLAVGTTGRLRVSVTPINWQGREGTQARANLDTSIPMRTARQSARRMIESATRDGRRRVATSVTCPTGAACTASLSVRSGGRTLGLGRVTAPGGMTDRLTVRLDEAPATLARLAARVSAADRTAKVRGRLG